jgi:hypothetical protein
VHRLNCLSHIHRNPLSISRHTDKRLAAMRSAGYRLWCSVQTACVPVVLSPDFDRSTCAALICLGRAEDLQMRGRRLQPCRIDWTAVARYPCCEALDVTVAKTDFTWPWRKLCKNLRGCASRLHLRHAIGKQKSTAEPYVSHDSRLE